MSAEERMEIVKDRFHYIHIAAHLADKESLLRAVEKLRIAIYEDDPVNQIDQYNLTQ